MKNEKINLTAKGLEMYLGLGGLCRRDLSSLYQDGHWSFQLEMDIDSAGECWVDIKTALNINSWKESSEVFNWKSEMMSIPSGAKIIYEECVSILDSAGTGGKLYWDVDGFRMELNGKEVFFKEGELMERVLSLWETVWSYGYRMARPCLKDFMEMLKDAPRIEEMEDGTEVILLHRRGDLFLMMQESDEFLRYGRLYNGDMDSLFFQGVGFHICDIDFIEGSYGIVFFPPILEWEDGRRNFVKVNGYYQWQGQEMAPAEYHY